LSATQSLTVNQAFADFMTDSVNLPAGQSSVARRSQDWLFQQIHGFPAASDDFLLLAPDLDIALGSFARGTKTRALYDAQRAIAASELERQGDQRGAIRAWAEILGPDFPSYG
jgi:hypothetical protein